MQATVKNEGNVLASPNYLYIYFTQDLAVSDDEIVSRVSVKELLAGESQQIDFRYPVSPQLPTGNYHVAIMVDPLGQVPESDEDNAFCIGNGVTCLTLNITNSVVSSQKFMYPVLFVHGWTGNSDTWEEFSKETAFRYGWSFGGRLDYCLNPDGDQSTSDGYISSFVNDANLKAGDYYLVNFDVAMDGVPFVSDDGIPFNDDYSNQSAIVKQGWAVSDAVEKVLEKTGAERVILVGHSMGGLASREYLQNQENWQANGEHHVAKLLTIGTPNGGSNLTGGGLGVFFGFDESSEAVRDLRYESLVFDGQYLDGGFEDDFSVFYNNDVDCNGVVGDLITGLNNKPTPSDVNYACIVGVGNNLPGLDGDGIVAEEKADLNNYLFPEFPLGELQAERFDVTTGHTTIHQENHSIMVRALDEPDDYELAYPIHLNAFQYGWCTQQAPNSPYQEDWDDFVVDVPVNGQLEVRAYNIPVNEFELYLLDEEYEELEVAASEGSSNVGFAKQLSPGTYFIEAFSVPTPFSWRFPYALEVKFTPSSPSASKEEVGKEMFITYPNPTSRDVTVQWKSHYYGKYDVLVTNNLGQIVRQSKYQKTDEAVNVSLDLEGLPSGAYFIQLRSDTKSITGKVVKK